MILLTSFLHRDDLKDIILRWMSDELLEEDCRQIKRIVNFNVYLINIYLESFCNDLFTFLSGGDFWTFDTHTKGDLKDFVIQHVPPGGERLEQLRAAYARFPEDFYRSTPFRGRVYCGRVKDQPVYLGHARIKRFRRVAEKASRRIIDMVLREIRKSADQLASERAFRLGIPKDRLITPPEEQKEEFAHAERRFLKQLKKRAFRPDEETVKAAAINDIAGAKAIIDHDRRELLESFLSQAPGCSIVEKEEHSGNYDAVNYVVRLVVDKQRFFDRVPDTRVLQVLSARGMERDSILNDYRRFVQTGEESVCLEIITCNYPEMIESEFGRSMHEDRILSQRSQLEYRSSVARNVRYITEYLFLFAISGKKRIEELPIKLWEKAMPDTYDHATRRLWDIPTMPVL